MKLYRAFINNLPLRRVVVLAFCIFVIWWLRNVMSTVLLTFIFTFLSINLIRFIQRHVKYRITPFWIITPDRKSVV